jgi:hypothetical protein
VNGNGLPDDFVEENHAEFADITAYNEHFPDPLLYLGERDFPKYLRDESLEGLDADLLSARKIQEISEARRRIDFRLISLKSQAFELQKMDGVDNMLQKRINQIEVVEAEQKFIEAQVKKLMDSKRYRL